MTHRALTLGLALALLPLSARAERYRVTIGNLPPILVDDATSYASQRDPDPAAPTRPVIPPTPIPTRPAPQVVPTPTARPAPIPPIATGLPPVTSADADVMLNSAALGAPTAAYTQSLQENYSITAADEVRQIWFFYAQEPATISDKFRLGNAIIRWMLAVRRPPTGMTTATPTVLPPLATRGTVRAKGGLPVRVAPWGESTNAEYPEGSVLELKAPAHGAWYRVTGPGPTGWVPGMWLDLK